MYARVSFPISSFKTFLYSIPKSLVGQVQPGSCVNAPINRRIQPGFVVDLQPKTEFDGKILNLDSIRDKDLHLPEELWKTLDWISKYYITPLGQVLKAAVPNTFQDTYKPRYVQLVQISEEGVQQLERGKSHKPAQKRILTALSLFHKPVTISSLTDFSSSPHGVCKSLAEKGWVHILHQPRIMDPFEIMESGKSQDITLSVEQQSVLKNIISIKKGFHPCLLHGVTGSGKTEVYLRLAQETVKIGKSVLVLVPEISLTPQVASRFRRAFGSRVALWHSRMTKAEKGWTWQQIKKGEYAVAVGARSAIFTPLKNLGLIIIDEEQETSYKQENPVPRYHARDVAMVRGKHAGATVLLTSATPSLESYYNALRKKFTLFKLTKRYGKSIYPSVEVVDMKQQPFENNCKLISSSLANAINERLEKSEQIILLQNRRGYALIQRCLNCGAIKKCQRCDVAMTFHRTDNHLHCHYCEIVENLSHICSECASRNVEWMGSGTQRVEDILEDQFPGIRILRMDMDTVLKRDAHEIILRKFHNAEADVLLGTQMIAKGLDFENVTLVGVINADLGLFFPDFRTGERVFQLIYQVAGRAGRRQKPGTAIIQTYNPDDIYIQTAASLNTQKFYNIAMAQRQELNYPPFSRIGRILFLGPDKDKVNSIAQKIYQKLCGNSDYKILGPTPAPVEKIQNMWRSHLIIKTRDKKGGSIHQFLYQNIGFSIFERSRQGIRIQVDIDPVSMM